MPDLSHLRLIAAGSGSANPYTTQVLADYGMQIIRVESPSTSKRTQSELVRLRGGRSIKINLDSDRGQELIERLAATADVLLTEPGIDGRNPVRAPYARLASANPRLIYCRITGFGDDGPMTESWKHDHLIAARYGVYAQPGWRPLPTFVTAPVPSLGAGMLALQAIGAALYYRERTGLGQEITTSLLAGALAFQPGSAVNAEKPAPATVVRPVAAYGPRGSQPFYSLYQCADGQWLHLGCLTAHFQKNAIQTLRIEDEMTRLAFGTPQDQANRPAIFAVVEEKIREQPFAHWAKAFEDNDVPHFLAQDTEALLEDQQVKHEKLIQRFDDPTIGQMDQMGPAVLSDAWQWQKPNSAPLPGQHADEILAEAGLSADEIEDLRAQGVVG